MIRPNSSPKPVAAAIEYRLPTFPVVPIPAPRVNETKWGGVYVERGRPTARHRDVLDAILSCGQRVSDHAGQLHVIFDVADVRRMLGVETDWRGIRKMLIDLVGTVISLRHPVQGVATCFPHTCLRWREQ